MISELRPTNLIPYALWSTYGPERSVLAKAELPHLRAWLTQAQRVSVQVDPLQESLMATLSPSHERAWAQAVGWPLLDGCLPWAAYAAKAHGLTSEQLKTDDLSSNGWAFISLCNCHVSNGQVTLGDPTCLHIDEITDANLFKSMQAFFAEDGIMLFPYKPGQWLAHSSLFVNLPTAALDRVIGCNIEQWLVGGNVGASLHPAAQLLRRLQNEMQMFLYTHPVNEGRNLSINSFWVHGTGALPEALPQLSEPTVIHTLRQSALQKDFLGWLEAWQQLDHQVIAPMFARVSAGESQRLVLCGEHVFHVYDSVAPSPWKRMHSYFFPPSLDSVLAVEPLED